MRYERESAYEVLEDVASTLTRYMSDADRVIKRALQDIALTQQTIVDINEYLDRQRCVAKDPVYCKHTHKKVTDDGKYETVTCADCGLMLSYILL